MTRVAVDTGGTFTDVVIEVDGARRLFKAPTVPDDPTQGILDALRVAATAEGRTLSSFLADVALLMHGTTHALNAVVTRRTARTAFLTTRGHPDILVIREGGRERPFDYTVPYPDPYIPRALTFEVAGRMLADGTEFEPFEPAQAIAVIERLRALQVEAVGVCLLWSIANPAHEVAMGALLAENLPGVPVTLSHRLNPTPREFRRASSTVVDASLKPLMQRYMAELENRLCDAGFNGRLLIVTSQGGLIDAAEAAATPVHLVNSGPSMAPIAAKQLIAADLPGATDVIVADAGGTTFDIGLVRGGQVPTTREAWLGPRHTGVMIGFPSIDIRSVGAGGGSIAWIDDGGLLHVGPQSAGAVPGPVAYGRGGTEPTVTDAAIVLGYLDPAGFLGGQLVLDPARAAQAVALHIADPLGLPLEKAAEAILHLATEQMASAITDVAYLEGMDPARAVIVGGGGAAGLNIARIAARLGCARVVLPIGAAALCATGALLSDLRNSASVAFRANSEDFDTAGVNAVLDRITDEVHVFADRAGATRRVLSFRVQARYTTQVWDIEVSLPTARFERDDVGALIAAFHARHTELFGYADAASPIDFLEWTAEIACPLGTVAATVMPPTRVMPPTSRRAYFIETGWKDVLVWREDAIDTNTVIVGPAFIDSDLTTTVVPPGAAARRTASGSVCIDLVAA